MNINLRGMISDASAMRNICPEIRSGPFDFLGFILLMIESMSSSFKLIESSLLNV